MVFDKVRLPTDEVVLPAATEVLPIVIGKPEEAAALLVHVVPLETSTLPLVPGATNKTVPEPLPRITLLAVSEV